jgi:hypothetical protein
MFASRFFVTCRAGGLRIVAPGVKGRGKGLLPYLHRGEWIGRRLIQPRSGNGHRHLRHGGGQPRQLLGDHRIRRQGRDLILPQIQQLFGEIAWIDRRIAFRHGLS